MADDNGVTTDIKKAKFLIVEEKIDDTSFKRLDYYFAGPMISMAIYRDKDLKIRNGKYAGYHADGYIATTGYYFDNKKDSSWYVYDDTGKATIGYKYHLDSLLSTTDMDSLEKAKRDIKEDTTGEIEAFYKGGTRKIYSIISSKFKIPERTVALEKFGTVKVSFVISTSGRAVDIAVLQSVEFAFDEEAMRVVSFLQDWVPASIRGKKLNAYRIQPITFQNPR